MKSTVIWSLVGLNLLLAAIVAARALPISSAQAQAGRPNEYLMIPGKTIGPELQHHLRHRHQRRASSARWATTNPASRCRSCPSLDLTASSAAAPEHPHPAAPLPSPAAAIANRQS